MFRIPLPGKKVRNSIAILLLAPSLGFSYHHTRKRPSFGHGSKPKAVFSGANRRSYSGLTLGVHRGFDPLLIQSLDGRDGVSSGRWKNKAFRVPRPCRSCIVDGRHCKQRAGKSCRCSWMKPGYLSFVLFFWTVVLFCFPSLSLIQ